MLPFTKLALVKKKTLDGGPYNTLMPAVFCIANSSCFDFSFISSIVAKRFQCLQFNVRSMIDVQRRSRFAQKGHCWPQNWRHRWKFCSFQLFLLISYGGLRVNFFLTSSVLINKNNMPNVLPFFIFVVEMRLPSMNVPCRYWSLWYWKLS